MRAQLIALAGAAALALGAGCGPTIECGEGTVARDGLCVPDSAPDGGVDGGGEVDGGSTCEPVCGAGFYCEERICVRAEVPLAWRCRAAAYADGEVCDCNCGLVDPDCAPGSPAPNCLSNACNADGTCAPCVPDCTGQACGDDGCGGSCGVCTDLTKPDCVEGSCRACVPDCASKSCGSDGCGGACGSCDVGAQCNFGLCEFPGDGASCLGICGDVAESGCSCLATCVEAGDCCADVARCGCIPFCSGKECGPDGCGGLCGRCADGDRCQTGACVDDRCSPDPCNGHGDCDQADGTCTCLEGFTGLACDACAPGYVRYPDCLLDACAAQSNDCGGHGTCDPITGVCACEEGFELQGNTCLAP